MADADMERRALEISCEEERIRRLAERMMRDAGDGAELARERGARDMATKISSELRVKGTGARKEPGPQDPSPSPAKARKNEPERAQKKWPPPPYEQRKEVFDELQASLEAISVKGIVDFRHITVVPKLVEDVAVGVMCLVAHVDDTVDCDEKAPAKSWATVQKVMSKPGHLINALRRYPYAVDAGRVPGADVKPAERVLERAFRVQQLEDVHPVAGMLYRWLYAAAHYFRLRSADKAQAAIGVKPSVNKMSPGKFAPPTRSYSATNLGAARGTPTGLGGGAGAPPPRAARTPPRREPASRSGVPRRQSPGMPKALPPKRPPAAIAGSLPRRTPPGAIDMESFRRELEATRKEVQKLKSQEADMQWRMERDARKENEDQAKQLEEDLMQWRWQQVDAQKQLELEQQSQAHHNALQEHLEAVQFKRQVRNNQKEQERQLTLEAYETTCANVQWNEQKQKERDDVEKKVLGDHIEDQKNTKEILAQQRSRLREEEERQREDERITDMDFERRKLLDELNRLRSSVGVVQNAYERRRK